MKVPPYPRYKNSGVEWIGQIPEHWEHSVVKRATRPEYKSFTDGDWIESPYITDDGVRLIQCGNIGTGQYEEQGYRYISEDTFESFGCAEVHPGDVLVCRLQSSPRILAGRACQAPDLGVRMITSIDNCILKLTDSFDGRFIVYQMSTRAYLGYVHAISRGGTRPRISRDMLGNIGIIVPPIAEQQAIADFLDCETAKIDALVDKKERLIELLQEKRTALVTHAVTKGLDPDVPMKESDIEWLGPIPEHWDVSKWSHCCRITEGQVSPDDARYRDRILIAPNHVESGTGKIIKLETADEQGAISGKYLVSQGDIIYSKIRPALNKACISTGDWLCSADMYPVRISNDDLTARFLLYYILSEAFVRLMVDESMRVAMPKVNREKLSAAPVLVPSGAEQEAIVEYLDHETTRIDALIAKVGEAIERLKEYRTALISAAVTGKIDVRDKMPAELGLEQ